MTFTVIIPARFASTRLPGKPLLEIAGKPLVQHVFENAVKSGAKRVVVATEDLRIEKAVQTFKGETCLTSPAHVSGTDRIAEVIQKLKLPIDEIIVNVQGDEPFIPPATIQQAALLCVQDPSCIGTVAAPIQSFKEAFNPTVVKVVLTKDNKALYFSRAPIPWLRDEFKTQILESCTIEYPPLLHSNHFYQHMGIYAYRAKIVLAFVKLQPAPIEIDESLEQLRFLWNGGTIRVTVVDTATQGVDTAEDLEYVRKIYLHWPQIHG